MDALLRLYLQRFGYDISKHLCSIIKDIDDYPAYYWALDKKNSLTFLELCADTFTPILGGSVHSIKEQIISVYSDVGWYYERVHNECFKDYLDHSIKKAKRFLKHYSFHGPDLFSFTLYDGNDDLL